MTPWWATEVFESIRVELWDAEGNQMVLTIGSKGLGLGSRGAARTSQLVFALAKVLGCLVSRENSAPRCARYRLGIR